MTLNYCVTYWTNLTKLMNVPIFGLMFSLFHIQEDVVILP